MASSRKFIYNLYIIYLYTLKAINLAWNDLEIRKKDLQASRIPRVKNATTATIENSES